MKSVLREEGQRDTPEQGKRARKRLSASGKASEAERRKTALFAMFEREELLEGYFPKTKSASDPETPPSTFKNERVTFHSLVLC